MRKAGLQVRLEQCQESMELKTHRGNKGSWGKGNSGFPRETQTAHKHRNQQEVCNGYLQLFMLMPSLVYVHDSCSFCTPKYTLHLFLMLMHVSQRRRTGLKKKQKKYHRLTPSDRGERSWMQPMSLRRIKGGRRPEATRRVQVWKHSASTLVGCFLCPSPRPFHHGSHVRWGLTVPSGNIFKHL